MTTPRLKFPILHTEHTAYDFISLAKQGNNPLQPYTFVNFLSAKHVPCNPLRSIEMFSRLAQQLNHYYPERKLVIGCTESAAALAFFTDRWLENRVDLYFQAAYKIDPAKKKDYLLFEQKHSPEAEQYLPLQGLEVAIQEAETIVFVEDELSSGNRVYALIKAMTDRFPTLMHDKKFVAASIVNRVPENDLYTLLYSNIRCIYLARLPEDDFEAAIKDISAEAPERIDYSVFDLLGYPAWNLTEGENLFNISLNSPKPNNLDPALIETKLKGLGDIVHTIKAQFKRMPKDVLVLGTEECMVPAILTGTHVINFELSKNVRVHATTRSCMDCNDKDEYYPLQNGHWLPSAYGDYDTYLYDLAPYKVFIIVSDADPASPGITALWKLLSLYGATPKGTYYIHIK